MVFIKRKGPMCNYPYKAANLHSKRVGETGEPRTPTMASASTWNFSSLRAALPLAPCSSSSPSVCFHKGPSPSRLGISRPRPGPRPLNSFVGLAPLQPLFFSQGNASHKHFFTNFIRFPLLWTEY